jgi:hypothetical protein
MRIMVYSGIMCGTRVCMAVLGAVRVCAQTHVHRCALTCCLLYLAPYFLPLTSCLLHLTSYLSHLAPYFLLLTSCLSHLSPYFLYLAPYLLPLTSCILPLTSCPLLLVSYLSPITLCRCAREQDRRASPACEGDPS